MAVLLESRRLHAPQLLFRPRLISLARRTTAAAGVAHHTLDCSVAFISPAIIREANRRYRGKRAATDVLSFRFDRLQVRKKKISSLVMGEILLCPAVLAKRARAQGRSIRKQAEMLFVHGVLHLLGYTHASKNAFRRMRRVEEKVLGRKFFQISPSTRD